MLTRGRYLIVKTFIIIMDVCFINNVRKAFLHS